MIKVKKTSYPPVNMGISLMLVVFIVICMIIFSILSLSTALKDYNYSKENAENTKEYYEACNRGERELALIYTNLSDYADGEELEYLITMNDDKALQIITKFYPSNNTYEIKTWKVITTTDWEGDDSIPVLGSQN